MQRVKLIETTDEEFKKHIGKTGPLSYDGYVVEFSINDCLSRVTSEVIGVVINSDVIEFITQNASYIFERVVLPEIVKRNNQIALYSSKGGQGVTARAVELAIEFEKNDIDYILVFLEYDEEFPPFFHTYPKNLVLYNEYLQTQELYADKVVIFDLSGLFRGYQSITKSIIDNSEYTISDFAFEEEVTTFIKQMINQQKK